VKLASSRLHTPCDPGLLGFETTAQAQGLGQVMGQDRALEALRFGVGMDHGGYNLYALGPPGIGKHTVVRKSLQSAAAARPTPADWSYINNFADPQKPIALQMPAGRAVTLKGDMGQLMETLRTAIPAAFDSEVYRSRVNEIDEAFKRQEEQAFAEIQREAEPQGMGILHTPQGFGIAPLKDGQVLSPEQFNHLPEEEQRRIEAITDRLKERLTRVLLQAPDRHKQRRRQIEALTREIAMSAIQAPGLISTASLEPQPIPLQVKVILLGDRLLYYLLCELDPDFKDLFKVPAEFEDDIARSRENERLYARLIADLIAAHGLLAFHREAVARVIEYGARLAGDAQKVSLHLGRITDLLAEADYWARQGGETWVHAGHVMDLAERLALAMQVPLSVVVSGASPRQSMALRTPLEQRLMSRALGW
jgi:hypothetical protein